jgi:CBS domain-containing protein
VTQRCAKLLNFRWRACALFETFDLAVGGYVQVLRMDLYPFGVESREDPNMKVQDVMVKGVRFCNPDTNLATVTKIFWEQGCGALPVVENGRAIGMITDRDIAIALGTRNAKAGETFVRDVALPKVFFCLGQDDIHTALNTMRAQQVRRLPVVDNEGALVGILSLDDIVLFAEETPTGELTYTDVVDTMKSIYEHPDQARILAVAQ